MKYYAFIYFNDSSISPIFVKEIKAYSGSSALTKAQKDESIIELLRQHKSMRPYLVTQDYKAAVNMNEL